MMKLMLWMIIQVVLLWRCCIRMFVNYVKYITQNSLGFFLEMEVKEVPIEVVVLIHNQIEEFNVWTEKNFLERCVSENKFLCIACYEKGTSEKGEYTAYMVAYDRYKDGSFYCWMTGVRKEHRRKGQLNAMMSYLETWCMRNQFSKLVIKTRNNRREMLAFLVKENWLFTKIETHPNIEDNRIILERKLSLA